MSSQNNSINNHGNIITVSPSGTSTGQTGEVRLEELVANGTNYVSLKSPDSLASNTPYTLPTAYPASSGQLLSSTTGGVLSWASISSAGINDNLIINPDMTISQRGTSFSAIANATYFIDRYKTAFSGTMVFTASQDTTVPTASQAAMLLRNSLLITMTTAQGSLGSTNYAGFSQFVEGYNFCNIAQNAFTFSFWVRSSVTGTYCVAFRNSGADRTYVAEYTISSANTWQQVTINVSASPSAGTWNYTNGNGVEVFFCLGVGSTLQTTANAWNTGDFRGTSNQTNFTATNSATFRVTGLKLEIGSYATQLVLRNITQEINLCNRYYNKSYVLTTNPGTATTTNYVYIGFAINNTFFYNGYNIQFPVEMRNTPNIVLYSPGTGTSGVIRDTTSNSDVACANSPGTKTVILSSGTGSFTTNHVYTAHYTADAEI